MRISNKQLLEIPIVYLLFGTLSRYIFPVFSLLDLYSSINTKGEKLARFPEVHGKLEITAMAFDNIPDDEGSGRRLISGTMAT